MNISLRALPIVATGLLALSSCTQNPAQKMSKYLDKNSVEYANYINDKNNPYVQSKLDSIAYRNIFETTNISKDSSAIREFNNITINVRNGYSPTTNNNISIINNIKDYLIEENISYRDYKRITDMPTKDLNFIPPLQKAESYIATEIQYRADK